MRKKLTYFYSLLLTALFLLPWSGMKADPVQVLFDNFDTDNFSDNWRMENCKRLIS